MKATYEQQKHFLKYILALLFLSAVYTANCQSIYDRTFEDINGKNVDLKDFAGKRLLFIILPGSVTDSLTGRLKNFVTTYGDKVQVIGVPSQEDGYSKNSKAAIQALCQNAGILVTEALVTRKGNGQSTLMKWLTNKNENGRFDMDAKGPGQKFFVNEQGKLYAVLAGKLPLSSPFINKIVNAPPGTEQTVTTKGTSKP